MNTAVQNAMHLRWRELRLLCNLATERTGITRLSVTAQPG